MTARSGRAQAALLVAFERGQTRRYRSLMHRADGVVVAFEGGSYNQVGGSVRDVPHDFAYLVVEDELRLRHGVWGVLAAGGLFRHATVVEGRQRPHAARRGREIVAAAGPVIMPAALAAARDRLRAAAERWWGLRPGEVLEAHWRP